MSWPAPGDTNLKLTPCWTVLLQPDVSLACHAGSLNRQIPVAGSTMFSQSIVPVVSPLVTLNVTCTFVPTDCTSTGVTDTV
ncbi:MAG: hypothetical protein HYU51_16335 [Candidatus Rokubacteria bacterium]|nr:hypothetical protein [Candidatus Rokubacteria bacterium]